MKASNKAAPKNRTIQLLLNQTTRLTAAALLSAVLGTGCAKIRMPSFGDGQGEGIFERSALEASLVQLETSSRGIERSLRESLRSGAEADAVDITEVEAPENLRPMFRDLRISGRRNARYRAHLKLDRKFLTVSKIAPTDELSSQERQLSVRHGNAESLVPLFQVPVRAYGQVVRVKNDLGEETSQLRLKPTDWSEATHVQISTQASDRNEVRPDPETGSEVFVREQLQGRLFTRDQFSELFDISLNLPGSAMVRTELNGSELNLFEVTHLDSLTPELRARVAAAGTRGSPIVRCSTEMLAELERARHGSSDRITAENCVAVHRYRLDAPSVAARRPVDSDGISGPGVVFSSAPGGSSRLLQLRRHSRPSPILLAGDSVSHVSDQMIRLSDVRGQEYLFRRTLKDSPNNFAYTFAGSAGGLEIVRFRPTRERMEVIRSTPLIAARGTTALDNEVLLSLPVRYFQEEARDSDGTPLASPRYVPTDFTNPNALALVDWAGNSLPNTNSALGYYDLEGCFDGVRSRQLTEEDRRLREGHLNFTLVTTYPGSRSMDCAGILSAGYFDTVQSNFTFEERFSFKKYVASDETPLFSVPYDAQKKLGFGTFTRSKTAPNRYGTIGVDGTEIPLAAIFDLRQNQTIDYVLAGVPEGTDAESRTHREAVIRATREVIADWNQAFRKALKGTALERSGDYVTLKIEGEEIEPRQMGDLERNYVYYIPKRTESGVIGLGGAHANPRSGKVEAASVFIYGGNIRSAVEGIRKMNAAAVAYEAVMNSGGSAAGGTGGLTSRALPGAAAVSHHALARTSIAATRRLTPSEALRTELQELSALAVPSAEQRDLALRGARGFQADQKIVHEALQSLLKNRRALDERSVRAEIASAALRVLGSSVPAETLQRLRAEAGRDAAVERLLERMRADQICVHESSTLTSAAAGGGSRARDLSEVSDEELLISVYKSTLAHEIGHNLGLRHNFVGSFDKANWKFDEADSSNRNYSSIMDYQSDEDLVYDGLGPYDVAAIRGAYAKQVELAPELVERLPVVGGRKAIPRRGAPPILLADNRFISLDDYRSLLGIGSWLEFTEGHTRALPLKKYQFCSDEDVGFTPVCNRFDAGTTPKEIVESAIHGYKATYSLRNFPGDRIHFGYRGMGSYTGRIFGTFLQIRQFLDETIYQAVTGSPAVQEYADAAIKGLLFFHEVVRTPDAPSFLAPEERFSEVERRDGSKVIVERKWLKSLVADMVSDRLEVRGIETDKIIALLMLTERSFGMPRYEEASIRVAYPQLEKLIGFTTDESRPDGLLTLSLLREILQDNVSPAVIGADGSFVPLDPSFTASASESMRYYAVLGSMLSLDLDGFEVSDNFSALFRVHSGFTPPAGVPSVALSGAAAGDLKYWAFGESPASRSLVEQVQLLDTIQQSKAELVSLLGTWFTAKQALDAATTEEARATAQAALDAATLAANTKLQSLPEAAGPRSIEALGPLMLQVAAQGTALQAAASRMDRAQLTAIVRGLGEQLTNLVKGAPVLQPALEAIPAQALGLQILEQVIPTGTNESARGIVFRNVQTLNQLFHAIHPEYRR
jgi:hypothetical protein